MFSIELGKKKITLIIVLLVLLPVVLYLLWNGLELAGDDDNIELSPLKADAGKISDFSVTIDGSEGVVHLPNNILPLIDGMLSTTQDLSFKGKEFTFQALIPPTATMINISIESSRGSRTFQVDVEKNEKAMVSGQRVYDRMEYVTDPSSGVMHRVTGHPQLEMGARYYKDVFESFGLEAEIVRYLLPSDGTPRQEVLKLFIWNVVAYHWGENTKEWIVLGGHYDMAPTTIEGAYDNTGGSNIITEIAQGISQLKTNKTIVFGLWSGEEEGLWGSREFVNSIPDDVSVKAYMNFDMAGINYPAPYDLACLVGPDEDPDVIEQWAFIDLINRSAYEILDYPEIGGVNVTEDPFGRSDHVRFQNIGVSTVFFFGADDDEYTAYHSVDDTLEEMESVAGGSENLIGGFDTVSWMGFYLTILLDNDDTVHQNV